MLGEVIGNFTISRLIGAGGMGEVWLGEQKALGTRVAIKLLQNTVSRDSEHVERLFNEARAVSRINHAGIAKIFDAGYTTGGRAYLVMEFLEGETLSSVIARVRRLPLAQISDIGRQIASVLGATHVQGITHRDLKPDNIFLVKDHELASGQRAKILDFGIAKLSGTIASPGTTGSMGTPAYMAPEQWGNTAGTDYRADMYSLGCVLFEMACGRPPFVGASYADYCAKHLTAPPPRVSEFAYELGPALDSIVARLLAKDPLQRGADMREVEIALAALGGAATPIFVSGTQAPAGAPATQHGGNTLAQPAGPGAQLVPQQILPQRPQTYQQPPPPTTTQVAPKKPSALVGVAAVVVVIAAAVIGYVATRGGGGGGSAVATVARDAGGAAKPPLDGAVAVVADDAGGDPYPCARVADRFVQRIDPRDVLPDIREVVLGNLLAHCTAEGWEPMTKRCFIIASTDDEMQACLLALPEGSQRGLDADYTASLSNLRRAWVTITPDRIELAHAINFNDATPTKLSLPVIQALAEALTAQPALRIEVQSHVDPSTDASVSIRRADAVRAELIKQGVDQRRIVAKGYGSTQLADTTALPDAARINTRIVIRILNGDAPQPDVGSQTALDLPYELHFAAGSTTVVDADRASLVDVARMLTAHPTQHADVMGYSDPKEPLELGLQRAQAVVETLKGERVNPNQLDARSGGKGGALVTFYIDKKLPPVKAAVAFENLDIPQVVHFDPAKDVPLEPDAIEEVAKLMKAHPRLHVAVVGNTDNTEDKEVGLARAKVVQDALLQRGVPQAQLVIRNDDHQHRLSTVQVPRERVKDRRVEFHAITDLHRGP